MQMQPTAPGNGSVPAQEQRRKKVTAELHALGIPSIAALAVALRDPDVNMRRNAALMLIDLGGGISAEARPKLNIESALVALIAATHDDDSMVRAWAAHAIAEIGPAARSAVPALITLLRDPDEGPRNTACIALGRIGPDAASALPALREALKDSSEVVRQFATRAIGLIQR